jgi:hypothetical protein
VGNNPTNATDPSGLARAFTDDDLKNAISMMIDRHLDEKEIALRASILLNVAKGKVIFPEAEGDEKRNALYWEDQGAYVPIKGKGWQAVWDLWQTRNGIQCNKYSKLIIIKSWIDQLSGAGDNEGLERLGKALEGREIPSGLRRRGSRLRGADLIVRAETPEEGQDGFQPNDLLPADQIWFKNPYYGYLTSAERAGPRFRGEQGSNLFYVGKGRDGEGLVIVVVKSVRVVKRPEVTSVGFLPLDFAAACGEMTRVVGGSAAFDILDERRGMAEPLTTQLH